MKRFVLVAILGVSFLSCGEIDGLFKVLEPIKLLRSSGREVALVPGSYSAEIEAFQRQSKIRLRVRMENNIKRSFYFRFPRGTQLPEGNQEFSLSSFESEQPYDLHGEVATEKWVTDTEHAVEDCTYEREYRVCDRNGHCRWETETVWGRQEVEYHFAYKKVNIGFDLTEPSAAENVLGHFDGERTDRNKIYEYQGRCY